MIQEEVNELRIKANLDLHFSKLAEVTISLDNLDHVIKTINEIKNRIEESNKKELKYKNIYYYHTDLSHTAVKNKRIYSEIIKEDNGFRFSISLNSYSYSRNNVISICYEKNEDKHSFVISKNNNIVNIFIDEKRKIKVFAKENAESLDIFINNDFQFKFNTKQDTDNAMVTKTLTNLKNSTLIFKGFSIIKNTKEENEDKYFNVEDFIVSPNGKNIINSVKLNKDTNTNNIVINMKTFFDYLRYNNGKVTIENEYYKQIPDFPNCKGKTFEEALEVIQEYQDVLMLKTDKTKKIAGIITDVHFTSMFMPVKNMLEYLIENTDILKKSLEQKLIFVKPVLKQNSFEEKNLFEGNVGSIENNLQVDNLINFYKELNISFDNHIKNKKSESIKAKV